MSGKIERPFRPYLITLEIHIFRLVYNESIPAACSAASEQPTMRTWSVVRIMEATNFSNTRDFQSRAKRHLTVVLW